MSPPNPPRVTSLPLSLSLFFSFYLSDVAVKKMGLLDEEERKDPNDKLKGRKQRRVWRLMIERDKRS